MSETEAPQETETQFQAPPELVPDAPDAPDLEPDEPERESETPPEPKPQGLTERELEARFRSVERAGKAYVRKLEEAFGPDFEQFLSCPMCAADFPGYIHIGKVGGFPREIVSQTNEVMTGFKQVEYKQLPGFQTCPTCDGEGKGLTGSRVPGKEQADCPHCQARGYLAPLAEQANGHAAVPPTALTAPDVPAFQSDEDVDSWGEPRTLPDGRDNPNFGRMPQFKQLIAPYGVTANLTAVQS